MRADVCLLEGKREKSFSSTNVPFRPQWLALPAVLVGKETRYLFNNTSHEASTRFQGGKRPVDLHVVQVKND